MTTQNVIGELRAEIEKKIEFEKNFLNKNTNKLKDFIEWTIDWLETALDLLNKLSPQDTKEETMDNFDMGKPVFTREALGLSEEKPVEKPQTHLDKARELIVQAFECTNEPRTTRLLDEALSYLPQCEQEVGGEVEQPIGKIWETYVFPEKEARYSRMQLPWFYEPEKEEKEKSWTPTPWELIEVSDDNENWRTKEFTKLQYDPDWYIYEVSDFGLPRWKYARPITPPEWSELPEYIIEPVKLWDDTGKRIENIEKHMSLVTNYIRQRDQIK